MKWIHTAGRLTLASGLVFILCACGGARTEVDYSQPCANFNGASKVGDAEVQTPQGERIRCIPSAWYFGGAGSSAAGATAVSAGAPAAGGAVAAAVAPGTYDNKIYLTPENKKTCAETYRNGEFAISTPAGLFCVSASFFQKTNPIPRPRHYGYQMCDRSVSDCNCRTLASMNLGDISPVPGLQGNAKAGFCY